MDSLLVTDQSTTSSNETAINDGEEEEEDMMEATTADRQLDAIPLSRPHSCEAGSVVKSYAPESPNADSKLKFSIANILLPEFGRGKVCVAVSHRLSACVVPAVAHNYRDEYRGVGL